MSSGSVIVLIVFVIIYRNDYGVSSSSDNNRRRVVFLFLRENKYSFKFFIKYLLYLNFYFFDKKADVLEILRYIFFKFFLMLAFR